MKIDENDKTWILRVAEAADKVLGWESIKVLNGLLHSGEGRFGADDGYNLRAQYYSIPLSSWDARQIGELSVELPGDNDPQWVIVGRCGYGSRIQATANAVYVKSCGGHWILAERTPENGIAWSTDQKESHSSWGDSGKDLSDRVIRLCEAEGQESFQARFSSGEDPAISGASEWEALTS